MSELSIKDFKRSLELNAFIHRDDEKLKEYLLGLLNTLRNLDEWCFDPLTVRMTPDYMTWPFDLYDWDIPLYDRDLHNIDVYGGLRRKGLILFDFDDGLRRILSQLSFPNHTFRDYACKSILIGYDKNRRPACYLVLGDYTNRAKKYLKINDYFSVTIPDDYKKYIYDLHQGGTNPEREIPITLGSKKENKSDFSVLLDTNFSNITYDEIVLFVKYWIARSERRVGKECRSRWSPYH